MNVRPFTTLHARAVRLLRDDIDTDQIIPARFLTTISRLGLGEHLFADWRYDADRAPRSDFPLNVADAVGAAILVAGRNFGCGSSREHAPWALMDWGFRTVIAISFADIFRSNANRNGLLTVPLDADAHAALVDVLEHDPQVSVTVNLDDQRVGAGTGFRASFDIDPFTKRCLRDGVDEVGFLLGALDDIVDWEQRRDSPRIDTRLLTQAPHP